MTSNQDAKVRLNLDVILHRLVKILHRNKSKSNCLCKEINGKCQTWSSRSYKALIEALSE